jgi:hypothetical protein
VPELPPARRFDAVSYLEKSELIPNYQGKLFGSHAFPSLAGKCPWCGSEDPSSCRQRALPECQT